MKPLKQFKEEIDSVLNLAADFAKSKAGKAAANKPFIQKHYAKNRRKK